MKKFILLAALLSLGSIDDARALGQRPQHRAALATGEHEFRAEGVRLWYRVAGRQNGTPLIFLHGGPGEGSQVFQAYGGPQLERSHRLVYLDQRGAGRSERPSDLSKYSMDILVDDVEQLRRHLGVAKIALLGHSFGTRLALEYAAKYPQHTDTVILAAAAVNFLQSLDEQCQRLASEDLAAYARAIKGVRGGAFPRCSTRNAYEGEAARAFAYRNLFPDPAIGRIVESLDSAHGGNTGQASQALFQQGYMQYRFTRAAQVSAPVLIVAGGRDFNTALKPQQDLARELPRARLLLYPSNGHFMFVEDPRRFARDVANFLRGRSPR